MQLAEVFRKLHGNMKIRKSYTKLFRRIVVQVLPEPALDLCHTHSLTLVIVSDLIAVDLTETKISRFRMGKVESTYARAGPHCERLRNQHSGIRLHIKQTPERTLLGVIWACWIPRSRPNASIFLLDKILVTQPFFKTVAPLIPHTLMKALGESLGQTIGNGLSHNRVVVVVLSPEPVAQFLQTNTAGYGKRAYVIRQPGFLRGDKVGERSTWLAAFPVCLLAEQVESLKHLSARAIRVQLDVITNGARGEKPIDTSSRDQVLLNDAIQKRLSFGKHLAR